MTSPIHNDKLLSVNLDRHPASAGQSASKSDNSLKTENSLSTTSGTSETPTPEKIDIRRAQQFYTSEQNAIRPLNGPGIDTQEKAQSLAKEISRHLAESPQTALVAQAGQLDIRLLNLLQSSPG